MISNPVISNPVTKGESAEEWERLGSSDNRAVCHLSENRDARDRAFWRNSVAQWLRHMAITASAAEFEKRLE